MQSKVRTVDITDYRYADGDTNGLSALAQELVLLKPDGVLASAVSPTRVMKRIAPTLPDQFVRASATASFQALPRASRIREVA